MEPPPQTMGMTNALEQIQRQLADDRDRRECTNYCFSALVLQTHRLVVGAEEAAAAPAVGLLPVPQAPAPAPLSSSVLVRHAREPGCTACDLACAHPGIAGRNCRW